MLLVEDGCCEAPWVTHGVPLLRPQNPPALASLAKPADLLAVVSDLVACVSGRVADIVVREWAFLCCRMQMKYLGGPSARPQYGFRECAIT